MKMRVRRVDWEFTSVFRIAYRVQTHAETILVELESNGLIGLGEASGVSYRGESMDVLIEQLAGVEGEVRNGISKEDLQELMPPGGARCAIDCALWDLEAKRQRRRAWDLAGIPTAHPLITTYTLGVDTSEVTAKLASTLERYTKLKLKLNGDGDVERVASVRRVRPDVELVVDANQAWNEAQLRDLTPQMAQLGVTLIEQPLPVGKDAALADFDSPVALCADESCQTAESLHELKGKYQYINIKLDKTGGLTEALRLARAAADQGFKIMVGCMGGSSLSMAPAFVVGQLSDVVDLDGPLLIKNDVSDGIQYEGNRMLVPVSALWG